MRVRVVCAALAALLVSLAPAGAKTLRWAHDRDVFSLDPYARQESFLLSFDSNIYEPLVRRGRDFQLEPALATRWYPVTTDRWRFELRRNARFADGTPFTAADVLFSFRRVRGPDSNLAAPLAAIRKVEKVDDFTVDIVTYGPDPILPQQIAIWDMMSAKWCQEHGAETVADALAGDKNYASDHADGTGPFMVAMRKPDVETVLVPNPHWWDQRQDNLDRVVFRPMSGAAAVAALLAGKIDMLDSVPPTLVSRVARAPGLRLVRRPDLRTILIGFNVASPSLPGSGLTGINPFRDRRVRAALYRAIDENTIKDAVMQGFATPAALVVGPGVNGFDPALDHRVGYDPAAAKALLAAAGYPKGFDADMDCPNDRYINDAGICRAVAAMLARVRVRVHLRIEARRKFFARLSNPPYQTGLFLVGWKAASGDALNALVNLAASRDVDPRQGAANYGGYANPALDDLLTRAADEMDQAKRLDLLHRALALVRDDIAYIPLHQQQVIWAARDNVDLVQEPDGSFPLRYVRLK